MFKFIKSIAAVSFAYSGCIDCRIINRTGKTEVCADRKTNKKFAG